MDVFPKHFLKWSDLEPGGLIAEYVDGLLGYFDGMYPWYRTGHEVLAANIGVWDYDETYYDFVIWSGHEDFTPNAEDPFTDTATLYLYGEGYGAVLGVYSYDGVDDSYSVHEAFNYSVDMSVRRPYGGGVFGSAGIGAQAYDEDNTNVAWSFDHAGGGAGVRAGSMSHSWGGGFILSFEDNDGGAPNAWDTVTHKYMALYANDFSTPENDQLIFELGTYAVGPPPGDVLQIVIDPATSEWYFRSYTDISDVGFSVSGTDTRPTITGTPAGTDATILQAVLDLLELRGLAILAP